MTDNARMGFTTTAHLYGQERVDVFHVDMGNPPFLAVTMGGLTLDFATPEALSGFLLAIAQSPNAQQFLAQAGAGFSLTVEPLPLPGRVLPFPPTNCPHVETHGNVADGFRCDGCGSMLDRWGDAVDDGGLKVEA